MPAPDYNPALLGAVTGACIYATMGSASSLAKALSSPDKRAARQVPEE